MTKGFTEMNGFTEMTRTADQLKEYMKDIFELLIDHEHFMGVSIDSSNPNSFIITLVSSRDAQSTRCRAAEVPLARHLTWMSIPLGDLPRHVHPITPMSSLISRVMHMYVTCRLEKGV
jgi:hypothetical protein